MAGEMFEKPCDGRASGLLQSCWQPYIGGVCLISRAQLASRPDLHGWRRIAVSGFQIPSAVVLICGTGDFSGTSAATASAALLLKTFVPVVDTCTMLVSGRPPTPSGTRGNRSHCASHIAHCLHGLRLSTSPTAVVPSFYGGDERSVGAWWQSALCSLRSCSSAVLGVGATRVGLPQNVGVGSRPSAAGGVQGVTIAIPSQRQTAWDGAAPAVAAL
jgi:hypothetical protein